MEIREVTEADIPWIAEMERAVFSEPWSKQSFREALLAKHTVFLTGIEGGRPVAYGLLYLMGEEAEIPTIAVDSSFWRKGCGRALLLALLSAGEKRGVRQVWLEVRQSNLPAQKLYRACGFAVAGCRKDFYRFPREDALVMKWTAREDIC